MKKIFFVISILSALLCNRAIAQSLPVGTLNLDDYYRRMQLLGKVDSNLSFSVRPFLSGSVLNVSDIFDPDSTLRNNKLTKTGPVSFADGRGYFQLLPLTIQQQFNSNHPYGWNDGAMIPAKGYQTMISGGFYIKYGHLSIQLRPEYVYAANPKFNGFATGGRSNTDLTAYYKYYNNTDQPERFGNGAYSKAFLGQSSIRLTFDPVSIGLSNENLWWGPGIHNSLILGNDAPGFKHLTFNTVRPIKTGIGYFEGQIVAAKLEGSGYKPLDVTTLSTGANLFNPKRGEWRYFTGFNLNYHPIWIPGLVLGLTRTFDAYHSDVKGFSNYVPFFFPYLKQATDNKGDPLPRDQYTSLYARWLFTKAQAEVYFEFGLNDNSYNYKDFVGSPDHSRAYVFGVRKMIPLAAYKDQYISINAEATQISQTPDRLIRNSTGWYTHFQIRHGYTNLGQLLGGGSGGNTQSMDISWVFGLKKLGIAFERYEHNVDLSQPLFTDINGNSRRWVDLAFALQGEWNYKNLLFNVKLQEIKSMNYEWVLKDYNPASYYIPHNNVYNFHGELGVAFRF